MNTTKMPILIIEDDQSQGQALVEAFSRSGFAPVLAQNPQQAFDKCKFSEFPLIIVDMLLPQKNGLDLAVELLEQSDSDPQFIFMSGVFKDKSIIKKAMAKVPTLNFFAKPLDLEALLSAVSLFAKPYLNNEGSTQLSLLYTQAKPSNTEIINSINETKIVNGFDMPWIYSLLLNSKISGVLNVLSSDGDIFSCDFHKGNMTFVNLKDDETYFGSLLVEMGFSEPETVNMALKNKAHKKIGQSLVDQNAISPHVIEVIKKEQMSIRLSKSTKDCTYEVNFEEKETLPEEFYLDAQGFEDILNNIILTKVTSEWLRTFFTPWLNHTVLKGRNYDRIDHAITLSTLKKFTKIKVIVDAQATLQEVLDANHRHENDLFKALYFLLTNGVIQFSNNSTAHQNYDAQSKRFKKLFKAMKQQNYFEILGVSRNAPEQELSRGYHELAKVLHPDKLDKNAPAELLTITEDIFSLITQAYTTLKNEASRNKYIAELEMSSTEEYLRNEKLMQSGETALLNRKYAEAFEIFNEIFKSKNRPSDVTIYYTWALIKKGYTREKKKNLVNTCQELLNQVPTEDRYSPDYFYVKGLYCILTGDRTRGLKCFKQCLNISPKHLPAKREISRYKAVKEKTFSAKTIWFDLDAGDAMNAIFKKRKKSG